MQLFLDDFCPEKQFPGTCPSLSSLLSLLERMPALLWTTDSDARFTSLAGAGLETTGVSVADLAGKSVDHLFHAAEAVQSAHHAHLRALEGHACSFDAAVNGRDLQAHIGPALGPDGAVVGVIGVALDLTERMVAERALRLSEHSYRSLIEEAPYAICRCTVGGQLLQVNFAMLEMLGYDSASEAELLIRDMPEIFSGDFDTVRTRLLAAGTANGIESTWVRRDGTPIQVLVSGRAIRHHSGEVSILDILAQDVTGQKHLEEQLVQAQKMQAVGQLAGGVAHDFNNLLTIIDGQVEIILHNTANEDLRERLSQVKQATDRAAMLTRQLLAFSRRQVLRAKVVDLNHVIGHLIGLLKRLIKEDVELVFLPQRDLGWVKADPYQIEQVLINLAVNAQDAMPRGGRLTIETHNLSVDRHPIRQPEDLEPGEYVQILVRDTGHGMDREVQARAFEPFFTTKKLGQGTGLGLSMAYGIVKQSGGHIRLDSTPGDGCTFWIHLPRVAPATSTLPSPPSPTTLPRGSETILLAEDETGVRKMIGGYLEDLGYRVLTASDGMDGISLVQTYTGTIHLLLTDLVMPKLGGPELAMELRKRLPRLKVIFLSGYAGHALSAGDLDLPDARFLAKPLSMEVLAKAVREVLDHAPA
jgi:PAS domain S-box-containing protein